MAKLSVSEYRVQGIERSGKVIPTAKEPVVARQVVNYSVATQSNPFGVNTSFIRVCSPEDVYLEFGANPVATSDSLYLPANTPEYFSVEVGHKLSAYDGVS